MESGDREPKAYTSGWTGVWNGLGKRSLQGNNQQRPLGEFLGGKGKKAEQRGMYAEKVTNIRNTFKSCQKGKGVFH